MRSPLGPGQPHRGVLPGFACRSWVQGAIEQRGTRRWIVFQRQSARHRYQDDGCTHRWLLFPPPQHLVQSCFWRWQARSFHPGQEQGGILRDLLSSFWLRWQGHDPPYPRTLTVCSIQGSQRAEPYGWETGPAGNFDQVSWATWAVWNPLKWASEWDTSG